MLTDENITNPDKLLSSQRKTLLLSHIKSIQPFVNTSDCRQYIEKLTDARIFFVVSGSLGENIAPIIHDLPQLTYIYMFCVDQIKHEVWAKQFSKIRGVFINDICLSSKLKDDVCSLSNINLPFGLFDSAQKTLHDLTKEQASFMWFQLIIEVLIRLPQTPEAKTEMIEECRRRYKDNEAQLEKITVFETIYRASDSIKWYTDNSFVFQLFNEAFRKQDFEIIFKYRYFLVDLYNQLSCLYNQESYKDEEKYVKVFRGQMMYEEELMKIKQNVGQLISINTFLSTSTSCAIAQDFSGNGEHQSTGVVSVIFEITVDRSVSCRPFAKIDELSRMQDELEILFSIGTIFRIESVSDEYLETIWYVKLTWTNEVNENWKEMKQLIGLLNFFTSHNIGDHPSILTFGLFLSKMGLARQAMRFYIYLLKVLPRNHPDRGVLHNNLGEVLRKLNYFNRARHHFEEALEYCTDTMSIYHPFWAVLHSNIAVLELTCERPKQALNNYHCALLISKRLVESDSGMVYMQEVLSTIYHGMAAAYYRFSKFQRALHLHEKALQIELYILPSDHPTLMESYHELGRVKIKLNKFEEALQNFEESLRIAQKNLLMNDWRLVSVHIHIVILMLYIKRDTSKILMHCSHVVQLLNESTFSPTSYNHLDVYKTLATAYLELGLTHLSTDMWEKYIQVGKNRLTADSNEVNFSDLLTQLKILESPETNSGQTSAYRILMDNKNSSTLSLSRLETITRCEIADKWRAMGYIQHAICYYAWLLENFPTADDPKFEKTHRSRLHNNLAACYQDLDNDQEALRHYCLALDILAPNEDHKSMHAAILHYNIALIYTNLKQVDEVRTHLHKSLLHISSSANNTTGAFGAKIYIALAESYERSNDWQMARDYYQRVIDQMKKDVPDHPSIAKFQQRLECVIDKINENTE